MRVKNIKWQTKGFYLLVLAIFTILAFQAKAATQSDAIAVRILPNINHDSIDVWYKNQGYKGSPQSLTVDGYEAIRDGRTVFVNAANLDTLNKKLYTNIYLISYNQDSETKTLDVLGQLISHWKFNNNINTSGSCSISNSNCNSDSDCQSGYICSNATSNGSDHSSAVNKGKCILEKGKTCLLDSDCPVNLFCDSLKAKTIRDTKRLGQMNQLRVAIENFKDYKGVYPTLETGTYLSGGTLSVWPSWKETLWPQLGLGEVLFDPINTLGYCEGYDAITCWSETKKAFVNSDLVLPYGSSAFAYKASQNGIGYSLCSIFETKASGYDTAAARFAKESCLESIFYGGSVANSAPRVVGSFTEGQTGKEFNGYIKVIDNEGDLISWSLSASSGGLWSSWQSSAGAYPVLRDTDDLNQKQIYHPTTGNPGEYEMILTLTDSRGAVSTSTIILNISAVAKPRIEADNADYFVDPINLLKYTFYLEGASAVPTYSIKPAETQHAAAKLSDFATMTSSQTSVGLNRVRVDLSFNILSSVRIPENVSLPFRITAVSSGVSTIKDIIINFKIEKPLLNFNCGNLARQGLSYPLNGYCLLGKTKSGNLNINYSVSGANGLFINYGQADSLGVKDVYLSGVKLNDLGAKTVTVRAENDYGASTQKTFDLKINNFCGDGILQKPNTEGRGGLYNDGLEECDGTAGTTNKISTSSALQYACNTNANNPSTFPIVDNNSCIFKSATEGGGFCGDGVCQFKVDGGQMMENCWNCQQDCGKCLATIVSKADDQHITYFNGESLYIGTEGSAQKTLLSGKNVFAFLVLNGNDDDYGLAFKLKLGPVSQTINSSQFDSSHGLFEEDSGFAQFDSASNLLQCMSEANLDSEGVNDWLQIGYNTTWPQAKINTNKATFDSSPYVWADSDYRNSTIRCRLALDYNNYNIESCQPNCSDSACGSDGCGGVCGTCLENQDCTSSGKCVAKCIPQCTNKCGGSDGCGSVCPSNACVAPSTCGGAGFANICGIALPDVPNNCQPQCDGKCGGPDGCGGYCEDICCEGYKCLDNVKCGPIKSFSDIYDYNGYCYLNLDCASGLCYDNVCVVNNQDDSANCCTGTCKTTSSGGGGGDVIDLSSRLTDTEELTGR